MSGDFARTYVSPDDTEKEAECESGTASMSYHDLTVRDDACFCFKGRGKSAGQC